MFIIVNVIMSEPVEDYPIPAYQEESENMISNGLESGGSIIIGQLRGPLFMVESGEMENIVQDQEQ